MWRGPDAGRVHKMFSQISPNYDKANSVLSLGVHHLWRKRLVALSQAKPGDSVLDCATGTGDLAIAFKRVVGETGRVVGTDFCAEMLGPAPSKAGALKIEFSVADVLNLPFGDNSFDLASISFGIRNVAEPLQGLTELARVVRPGGKVMILEFGRPKNSLVRKSYDLYSNHLLPKVGGWITGRPEAYQYLQETSAAFPYGRDFVELMRKVPKFKKIEFEPVSLGIAYIYTGTV